MVICRINKANALSGRKEQFHYGGKESYAGKINRKLTKKLRVIAVAAGREKGRPGAEKRHLCQCILQ